MKKYKKSAATVAKAEATKERMAEMVESLAKGAAAFKSSDSYKAWLDVAAKFHKYSPFNQMLIMVQRPDSTQVAGYNKWLELGRQVVKGAKAIRIYGHPVTSTRMRVKANGEEVEESGQYFPWVSVFDVSDTEGDPLPELAWRGAADDSGAFLYEPLVDFAGANGIAVTTNAARRQEGGHYSPDSNVINVVPDAPSRMVRVIIHELAHALDIAMGEYTIYSEGEIVADSVSYLVRSYFDVISKDEKENANFAYVANWSGRKEVESEVKKVQKRITDIAGMIINALVQSFNTDSVEVESVAA